MSAIFGFAVEQWRECRAEFTDLLEAAYERAETATNGKLLNQRGKDRQIDAYTLFYGTRARAYAYASPELVEHWERYPRITFAEFERQRTAA